MKYIRLTSALVSMCMHLITLCAEMPLDDRQDIADTLRPIIAACALQQTRTFKVGEENIHALAFSPDTSMLACAGDRIKIFDLTSGKKLYTFAVDASSYVSSLSFNGSGVKLACQAGNDTSIWDLASGEENRKTFHKNRYALQSIAYNQDDVLLCAVSHLEVIKVRDRESDTLVNTVQRSRIPLSYRWCSDPPLEQFGNVRAKFIPGARALATEGFYSGRVWLRDTTTGKKIKEFAGNIDILTLSQDGQLSGTSYRSHNASATVADEIILADMASGREIKKLSIDFDEVASLAFSQDGSHLAAGLKSGSVQVWQTDKSFIRKANRFLKSDKISPHALALIRYYISCMQAKTHAASAITFGAKGYQEVLDELQKQSKQMHEVVTTLRSVAYKK